jgi:hypothetical protein
MHAVCRVAVGLKQFRRSGLQQSHNRVTQRFLPNDAEVPVNHLEHYERAEKA